MTSFPQLKPVAVDRLVAGAASVVATTLNTVTARMKNIVLVLALAVNTLMCPMLQAIYLFGTESWRARGSVGVSTKTIIKMKPDLLLSDKIVQPMRNA